MPQSKLLLVVDDTAMSRMATCMLVEGFGYKVDEAVSGKEALQLLRERDYDCIIMDYQMPGLSGSECTEYIRNKLQRHIPIIGYTSSDDSQVYAKCIDSGMDACLSKTGPVSVLEDTLKRLIFAGVSANKK